jgi:hypothetical protein
MTARLLRALRWSLLLAMLVLLGAPFAWSRLLASRPIAVGPVLHAVAVAAAASAIGLLAALVLRGTGWLATALLSPLASPVVAAGCAMALRAPIPGRQVAFAAPLAAVGMLAALRLVPDGLLQAAAAAGAGPVERLRLRLRLAAPGLAAGVALALVGALAAPGMTLAGLAPVALALALGVALVRQAQGSWPRRP